MSYIDDLNQKKLDQLEEQKRKEQVSVVSDSGDKVVEAVQGNTKELTGSLNNLLMATLVAKDPKIAETAKRLVSLSDEINKATKNIKDSNFKPLADSLKVLQETLKDIPSQIEDALETQDPTPELRAIADKIGKVKYDPNIRVDVKAPDVDFTPITKLLGSIEKAFKSFKVDIPDSDFSALQSEMSGVKKAINNLRFPVPNYILPYKDPTTGKATQVLLDSSGNVPVSGTVSVDTTGLATSAKQDAQTALLTTIDADTSNLDVALSTRATAAKQDTGNTSLSSIDGKITAVNTGAVVVSSSALPSGAATAAKQPALGTAGTSSADVITVQGRAAMTPLLTDGSATTQPVSGTVTANAGSGTMAVSNAGLTELEAAINSSKVDVNIASSAVASGGTSAADDADFTAGTTSGTPAMGVYESTPTSVTDGDLGTVGITTGRRLKTSATIDAALPAGTNNIGDVDVLSSALPTGAATSTIQTDGSQKTQIVDAGGEQVTVTGGKLDVNATVSGGVGSSAVDDAAFAIATDSGTPAMGLFDDVTPDSVGEGDVGVVRMSANRNSYQTIRDAAGNERGVNVTAGNALTVDGSAVTQPVSLSSVPSHAVTNAGTFATQVDGAALTALQLIDDPVATLGTTTYTEASTKGNIIGAVRRDANTTLVDTTNEVAPLQVNATGELKVAQIQPLPAGTNNIGDVDIASIAAGDNNIGNVDVVTVPADPFGANADAAATAGSTGSIQAKLRLVTSQLDSIKTAVETLDNTVGGSELQVDVVGALPAGTNAIGKLAANSGVDIGDVDVTSAVSATLDHGSNLDIDTSAEQITSTSFACKFGVTLRAPIANTGILYIGNSDVTASGTAATDGIPLYPGDSLFLPVTNSNIPYAIASANNQTIYWIAV